MAKISFVGLDGAEKTHRLQTQRPFTLGRDPGNDIILRDPKVSRHHAEIVFERGFFVLHDLSSANGTFVNGKRIRIAPLTHGSRLKLGNTHGRFSEELPTESDVNRLPLDDGAADPFEQPVPPAVDLSLDAAPTSQHTKVDMATAEHQLLERDTEEKKKPDSV